jgi:hypothetical protein
MWSQDGYTATSILTVFDMVPVEGRSPILPPPADANTASQGDETHWRLSFSIAAPAIVLMALLAAGAVWIVRSRARRAA